MDSSLEGRAFETFSEVAATLANPALKRWK